MRLNDLTPAKGANKKPKRVGRGMGSGHGKTSGRGHKGQKARSGYSKQPGFEGGQMPLARRIPKRGFRNPFKRAVQIVNIEKFGQFKKDSTVTPTQLKEQGLINKLNVPVKVLGKGKMAKPLQIQVHAVSQAAKQKIEQAGGKIELIK